MVGEVIHTIEISLSKRTERAFSKLRNDPVKAHICGRIFKALTGVSSTGKGICRTVSFGKLSEVCETEPENIMAILQLFLNEDEWGRDFNDGQMPHEDLEIRISEKSNLNSWERLKTWISEEKHAAEIYLQLVDKTSDFKEGNRGYLADSELTDGLKWYNENSPNAAWSERYHPDFDDTIDFLFQSMEQDHIAAVKNENIENQTRGWGAWISLLAGIAAVVAIAMGVFTFWPSDFFNQKAEIPSKTEVLVDKIDVSSDVNVEAGYDSFIANLARQKAEEHAEKTRIAGAKTNLPKIAPTESSVWWEEPDRSEIPSVELEIPEFLKVETVVAVVEKPAPASVKAIPIPEKEVVIPKKEAVRELPGEITLNLKSSVRDFAFHPNRGELIAGCDNGYIQKIRIVDGKLIKGSRIRLENEKIRSVDYSKDAKLVAAGTESGLLVIFSNAGGKLTEITRHPFNKAINQVGFLNSGGGQYMAVGNVNLVSIVKVEDQQITITDQASHGHIGAMNIGKSGKQILVADLSSCYIYRVSEADGSLQSPSVVKTSATISSLALDRRANILATGLVNGNLVISKLNSAHQIEESKTLSVHRSLISSLDFHRDGSSVQLVSSGFDQTLTLLDVPDTMAGDSNDEPRKFKGHNKWVYKGKFGNTGKYMVSSSEDGKVFIWDTKVNELSDDALGFKR